VSAVWDLEIDGESFRHTRDTSDEPDVIFRTDGEAYVLTGVGRMDLFEALASGRIKAEGPAKDIEAYASHFPPL
jgi:putative sterol carrier protein